MILNAEHQPVCNQREQEVASVSLPFQTIYHGQQIHAVCLEKGWMFAYAYPTSIALSSAAEGSEGAVCVDIDCTSLSKAVMVSDSSRYSKTVCSNGKYVNSREVR